MIDRPIRPVIISGGYGQRLWPLSRQERPKQFLPLCGGQSPFEATLQRVTDPAFYSAPVIVAAEANRFMVRDGCAAVGVSPEQILLEPVGRNTAAAIALAALQLDERELMLVLPSDHYLDRPEHLSAAVAAGRAAAEDDYTVVFGITPDHAHTGYGYIKATGTALAPGVFTVDQFVEKPDLATATGYLDAGGYFWNAGMFMMRAGQFVADMARQAPDILAAVKHARKSRTTDPDFVTFERDRFAAIRAESVDYAVMEKADRLAVVPVSMAWSDLGSFAALAGLQEADKEGNRLDGADAVMIDSRNSYIRGNGRLVATIGLDNIAVIDTDDALLIANRGQDQKVREVVARLQAQNRPEVARHKTTHRPWGSFRPVASSDGFLVKEIRVYPGRRLSLQKHHHRSEHWVVVHGTAKVTKGEDVFLLSINESVYIPQGVVHRLENCGRTPLIVIEVQTGRYLGEDDIVRLEDDFHRQ